MSEKISYGDAITMSTEEIAEANAALDLYNEAMKKAQNRK